MTKPTLEKLAWALAGIAAGLMLGHALTILSFFKERFLP